MYDSQVVQLLRVLSKKEFKDLLGFINSSIYVFSSSKNIHNTISRKKIISLYEIFEKEYPEFKDINLDRNVVFKKLYPNESYSDKKFRNIKYEFTRIIESFLSFIDFEADPVDSKLRLLDQLRKRNIEDQFKITLKNLNKSLDKSELKNDMFYYRKYLLTEKEWLFVGNFDNIKNGETYMRALKQGINFATSSFLMVIFKQLHYSLHYGKHFVTNIDTEFYSYIYKFVDENKSIINGNPVLQILYTFLKLRDADSDKNVLVQLKERLSDNEKNFERSHYQFLCIDLLNICINRFLGNETEYRNLLMDVLKYCIDKEVYLEDGFMHEHSYVSIVSLALRLKEMNLAESLIIAYKDRLPLEFKNDAYSYNYASYYFANKEYSKALDSISKVKNNSFYYTTDLYNLQLRIYYELNETESAINLIDTYKHFFTQGKQIPTRYEHEYKKFLKYFEKILKIKIGNSKIEARQLILMLDKEKEIAFKGWLGSKLIELEKIEL